LAQLSSRHTSSLYRRFQQWKKSSEAQGMTSIELEVQKELMKQRERNTYLRKKSELLRIWDNGLLHLMYFL
jgi:hypothetical protein